MRTRNYFSYDEDSSSDSNSYTDSSCVSIDYENLFQEHINIFNYNSNLINNSFSYTNENFKLAFNQAFILRKGETKIDYENKKNLFSTEHLTTKRKRGRFISKKNKRKEHNKYTEDNVITKIQNHYMNFIIDFINDFINSKDKRNRFIEFNYKVKSDISKAHRKELEDSSINDLLNNILISKKYKKCPEYNKNLVGKLLKNKKDTSLKDLFGMKYLELFDYYYNNNEPLKEIEINNKIIKLSPDTETFYTLIQNNEDMKERILKVAEKIYINKIDLLRYIKNKYE